MCKEKEENVEIYFICYKKREMELVESYYDEILNTQYWYFNAYLAYKEWKKKFKNLHVEKLTKDLLTLAASRYLIYQIENHKYKNAKEERKILKDLESIEEEINIIIAEGKNLEKQSSLYKKENKM